MIAMGFKSFVRRQKRHVVRETDRVKDFSVFDFDYVPEEPLLREEARQIITEMLRFERSGIPTNHFVIGSRGCGKTLTLRYLQRAMPEETNLRFVYANCRQHNTSFKIFAHLLRSPPRGVSLAELAELSEAFVAKSSRKTVVLLDEVELMSPKDRNREIFYLLSRAPKPFMIVALSNTPRVVSELDVATRSSLQAVQMHFRNYDARQVEEILTSRARQGLHRWDDAGLAKIAALTVRHTNADVRVAIKTLYYTVTQPQQLLDDCFERARRDVVINMIADLSETALGMLWAVTTSRTAFAKDIYVRYRRFCESRGDKPVSYVYFCSNLSYLQSAGLVALVATKVGRSYPNQVIPTFESGIVGQICKARFGWS